MQTTHKSGQIDFKKFEEFINENDLEEALALLTGNTGPVEINTSKGENMLVAWLFYFLALSLSFSF